MGFQLSWVAVRGKPQESVYAQLGLRRTGAREEVPDSPIVGASLPSGWSLVVADREDRMVSDSILQPLSAGCEAVACFVEEHVMFSTATGWTDGRKVWSVTHDAQQDIEHLEAEGDLPQTFGSVRDGLRSKQQAAGGKTAEVDYIFSVPVELARLLTGFSHEKDIAGAGDRPFEVLEGMLPKPPKKSWMQRLFGG